MSGAYEREAIRPHVLGRFSGLLLTTEGHPAMLFYLDQTVSMGPNSVAGINRTLGLNENFAREILELHTLGVRTGYTQNDVLSFANVLTGWTLVPPGDNPEHGGEFAFNPRLHEPGAQKVLGKNYEEKRWSKDVPCSAISRRIRQPLPTSPPNWRAPSSRTNLRSRWSSGWQDVCRYRGRSQGGRQTMVLSDEAWTQPITKLKRPSEWVVGIVRATGLTQADPARFTEDKSFSANRCGVRPRPRVFRTTNPPGSMVWGGGSMSPTISPSAWPDDRPPGDHRECAGIFGVGTSEAGGWQRREPATGAGAVVHVSRVPAEVSMAIHRHLPSRREALLGAGTLFAWSLTPGLARAEGRDPRMLVIVLRGALDGLGGRRARRRS